MHLYLLQEKKDYMYMHIIRKFSCTYMYLTNGEVRPVKSMHLTVGKRSTMLQCISIYVLSIQLCLQGLIQGEQGESCTLSI